MGDVYAANQVVDTTKSPTTFIDTTANGVDLIKVNDHYGKRLLILQYASFYITQKPMTTVKNQ
jgi:hypothetical protein